MASRACEISVYEPICQRVIYGFGNPLIHIYIVST
jgi:hypothetical protein